MANGADVVPVADGADIVLANMPVGRWTGPTRTLYCLPTLVWQKFV